MSDLTPPVDWPAPIARARRSAVTPEMEQAGSDTSRRLRFVDYVEVYRAMRELEPWRVSWRWVAVCSAVFALGVMVGRLAK